MDAEQKKKWLEDYDALAKVNPVAGTILKTLADGKKIKLFIDFQEGKQPFIFALAHMPSIFGAKLGWYAIDSESNVSRGLKCILTRKSGGDLIKKYGLSNFAKSATVSSLLVLKPLKNNNGLVVEISEL